MEEYGTRVIHYNKLVRDLIPDIITASGKTCTTSVLSDADYITMLDAKLNEELAEYQESKSMEELADLLEVIRAVVSARGSSIDEVEQIRQDKAAKRGGFEKHLLLTEVRSEDTVWKKLTDAEKEEINTVCHNKPEDYYARLK